MNRIYLMFFIISLICLYTKAQKEWAPVGAKWYYSVNQTNNICSYIESVGDTIIEGKTCKILDIEYCNYTFPRTRQYICQQGDSVFYYNKQDFFLLYDFSAKVGDTITVFENEFNCGFPFNLNPESDSCTCNCLKYSITDIDSITVEGQFLKRQHINTVFSECNWRVGDEYIIEKLGNLNYFFGSPKTIIIHETSHIGMLRCYQDQQIEYENPDWSFECDYDNIVGFRKTNMSRNITVYPNPVFDYLNIKSDIIIENIKIYTIVGHLIQNIDYQGNSFMIDLKHLNQGLYFIVLKSNNNILYSNIIKVK